MLAGGSVFGPNQIVELRLLEVPQCVDSLQGVKMELLDCAYPTCGDIVCTADPAIAFKDCTVCILIGGFPRKPGMLRKDLIAKNTTIFSKMGADLANFASPNCKVLVVANPANTNCLTLLRHAGSKIPYKNFAAMTRLDYNRATAQVALKTGTPVQRVKNVIIWGNHSATQYPDATTDGFVEDAAGAKTMLADVLRDDQAWLDGEFLTTVQQRGKAIIDVRGKSSAMSAANAAADCVRTWLVTGTEPGETVAMAVFNDKGYYGVAEGLFFSFPCECSGGDWRVKEGLVPSEFAMAKIKASEAELMEERSTANEVLASEATAAATKSD